MLKNFDNMERKPHLKQHLKQVNGYAPYLPYIDGCINGVIPMIISKSALWAPMGVVICFGTITSMIFLVLILPVAYWLIFRKEDKNKKKITKAELQSNSKIKPALLTLVLLFGLTPVLSAQNQNNYTLEQCKTLALQNNAQIKNKVLDVESSQQVKKAAYTKYFPLVDATAFAYKFTDPLINMEMQGGNLPVYDGNPANLPLATQFAYSLQYQFR